MSFRKSKRNRSRHNSVNHIADINEKWRPHGRRFSRRDTVFLDQDSDEEEPLRDEETIDWAEEFFGRKSVACMHAIADQDMDVQLSTKQTLILATLVPNELLEMPKYDYADPKRLVGVLMMADVAGYTALSERYTNTGKGGTYRLTVTLNTYIGALLDIIYGHGGDVIKFAGDAFLALWKTDKKTFLSHTIHTVITCALVIQHSYGKYETDVKVNLRVKLAISAGNLLFSVIGRGIDMNYILFGLPVLEAKLAESVCSSGEVKLTPTAWAHCYSRNYDHTVHDDGHITIKTILYDPHDNEVNKPFLGFGMLIRNIKRPYTPIEQLPENLLESSKNMNPSDMLKKVEALFLRKEILIAEERNIGSEIRKFMIQPILTQIDAHQPLEYLTEMRQVSVVFITLKPRESTPLEFITIVNNAYQITCEIVYKSMGCVNKIILFDKDIMILVIFGLRGFKHESEAQAALKCGYSIRKSLAALDGVLEVSLGVTTGPVYCGVVGHSLRREFTVIGAVVNKAARLMCMFRNKITCDETTFIKSKMSSNSFTLQPRVQLKGIVNPGKIYEYSEEIRLKELGAVATIPPLLDREDELQFFHSWMKHRTGDKREFDALLIVGESRIGKTRLLEWMSRIARHENFHVCVLHLTSIHSATSYLALSQIVDQILDVKDQSGFEKEQKICNLLKMYDEDLCYLNNIIKVRYAFHEGIFTQDPQKRNEKAKVMFKKFIMSIGQPQMIFLDDLHNLDAASWEYLSIIFESPYFFTVLSVTRGKFSSVHTWLYSVFINESVRKMVLGPLASVYIPTLACQILDVDAVPRDLCNALVVKCNGMPGLVESFIVHLFSTGAIELKKIPLNELDEYSEEDLRFPDPSLLRPVAVNLKQQEELDEMLQENDTDEVSVCIVTEKEELNVNINVQNVDALIMIQIDSLTPYQQLLLKIASVIGNVFSRDLLENIMYENQSLITAKAIKRLFALRILGCANVKARIKKFSSTISTQTNQSRVNANIHLTCECPFEYDAENEENLPKYAFCRVIKFKNKNTQLTCYELLPMNQKKEFHSRIVNYLESNKQKCPECGGTLMVLESYMNIIPFEDELPSMSTTTREESEDSSIYSEDLSIQEERSTSQVLNTASEILRRRETRRETNFLLPLRDHSQSHSILKNSAEVPNTWNRVSNKRVTVSSFIFKSLSDVDVSEPQNQIMLRPLLEAQFMDEWHEIGVTDSSDKVDGSFEDYQVSIPLQKGVSSIDFKKCTCVELNILLYEQLVAHATFSEMREKVVEFSIELSYLNLMANNFESASEVVHNAEEILINHSKEMNLTSIQKKIFVGRIFSLKSATEFIRGDVPNAKIYIDRACRLYGLKISHVTTRIVKLKSMFQNMFWMKRKKYKEHEEIITADSVFCLNVATSIYSALADDKTAKLTSMWALERIQQVYCKLEDVCDALSIGIQVELDRGCPEGTVEIERIFKLVLTKLKEPVQADKLYSIGKVLMACFRARMARAEIPAAIRSGFRAIMVSKYLNAYNVSVDIIPDLFYILLARRRFEEAIDVVNLAITFSQSKETKCYETWYYALSMDLILDAGFQLASPGSIYKYSHGLLLEDNNGGAARRRLFVNLWTYWLRMDNERRAKKFEDEALSWSNHVDGDYSLTALLSSLRLAEGMLESLARKMDDIRKVVDVMELRSIADKRLNYLERECRLIRTIYPRWIRLKSFSQTLSGRHNLAATSVNQATEEAQRIRNHLEKELSLAVLTNSKFWVNSARSGIFLHWKSGAEEARDGTWHQIQYKMSIARRGQF